MKKKKKEEQTNKSKKEEKKITTEEQWRRKKSGKKKGQKLRLTLTNGSLHMCLITEMPLETELWKLKTPKMCFQLT